MVLDPDALVSEARASAQLDDFGSPSFREGLDAYCASVASEAHLSEVGVMGIQGTVVGSLVNRLRVADYAARNPGVAAERIDAPLFVIGMFRAGTTFLSYLLERDPANRALLRWEAGDSVPPPTLEDLRAGPRVDAARVAGEMLEQLNPRMRAIHHEEPDGPTECISVMSQDFKSLSWEAISNVPSYSAWLMSTDHLSAYEYHRLVLQVLQHGGARGRWTLKSPHHAIALDALTAVYPDARFVLLHRDPVELCGSVCSLITELSGCFTEFDHRDYIAEHWVAMLEESIHRIDAFRRARPDHPVVDIQYDSFARAPVETVAAIYTALGEPMRHDVRNAMAAYVDANRRASLGVHRYDVRDFGLEPDQIRERFASYVARYDVPTR